MTLPPLPEWFVKVSFFGICTHIHPERDSETHDVVLVNASDKKRIDGHPSLKDKGITEHDATLQILRGDLVEEPEARPFLPIIYADKERVVWALDGVFLRIANAVRTVEGARQPPACIPHLENFCDGLTEPRTLADGLETRGDTACLVRYPSSPYVGQSHNPEKRADGGAAVGVVTIGCSALPAVHVGAFGGGALSIPVKPGAEITVANIPKVFTSDKDADFLLHFLALGSIPNKARYPGEGPSPFIQPCPEPVSTKNLPYNIGDGSTPGCSNSNYP
jgi:hypothetical protein